MLFSLALIVSSLKQWLSHPKSLVKVNPNLKIIKTYQMSWIFVFVWITLPPTPSDSAPNEHTSYIVTEVWNHKTDSHSPIKPQYLISNLQSLSLTSSALNNGRSFHVVCELIIYLPISFTYLHVSYQAVYPTHCHVQGFK